MYILQKCAAQTPIEIEIAEGDGTATDLMVRPEAARSYVAARHRPPRRLHFPFAISADRSDFSP